MRKNCTTSLFTWLKTLLFACSFVFLFFETVERFSFKTPTLIEVNVRQFYVTYGTFNITNIKRPLRTETVYPLTQSRDYLLNNVTICFNVSRISVLFIVHSAIANFVARENIRSTFASRWNYLPHEVRIIFLLGRSLSGEFQEEITMEYKKHKDIIQGDFIDTYHNLTHKSVMGLRWVYENCKHIKYVIKTDDDVVFDTKLFFQKMYTKYSLTKKTLWCTVCPNSTIYRTGKWKVEKDQFKGYKRWPWAYCAGFVVVITGDLLTALYQASLASPFFWIDDVYTFGVLPSRVGEVQFKSLPHDATLETSYQKGLNCLSKLAKNCHALAIGAKTNEQYWNITILFNKRHV